jgi:pentatricopeptide repeat protein
VSPCSLFPSVILFYPTLPSAYLPFSHLPHSCTCFASRTWLCLVLLLPAVALSRPLSPSATPRARSDSLTNSTMMQFYLQTRPSRDKVLYYYTALRQSGVQPSVHTYKLLLDAYHTISPIDLTSMERTFAELCADRSLQVQGTHWASLITAYGLSNGDVEKALEVFDLIATHPSNTTNALSEPVVWEAILNVLASKGTLEQMESMRERMEGSVKPTAYVYNVLISGYARHSSIEKARGVFESMYDTHTGVSAPNNHPTQGSQTVEGVYREPSTYETMIRAELSTGSREAAEGIIRRMEERGYPAAVYFKARALLDGYAGGAGIGAGGVGLGGGVGGAAVVGMGSYHPVPRIGLEGQDFAQ